MRNGVLLPAVALFAATSLATAQTIPVAPSPQGASPGQLVWPAQPGASQLRWPVVSVSTAESAAPPVAKEPAKEAGKNATPIQDVVGHPVADIVTDDAPCHGAVDTLGS